MEKDIEKASGKKWKEKIKLAFDNGILTKGLYVTEDKKEIKLDDLSDKEKKYLEGLQKAAKPKKVKETIIEKAKRFKELVLANANAFADRVLNTAISNEEKAEAWKARSEEVKRATEDQAKAKKEAKAERKIAVQKALQKTVPITLNDKEAKNQEKQLKAVKEARVKKILRIMEYYEKKGIDVEAIYEVATEISDERLEALKLFKKDRKKREQKKAAIRKAHGRSAVTEKLSKTKKTKEQKRQERIERKNANRDKHIKMMNEHAAAKIQMTPEQKEEAAKKAKRAEDLAATRIGRMNRKTTAKLVAEKKKNADIKRFKESEERRLLRKRAAMATYLTKGGKETPKVKNKVAPRPFEPTPTKKLAEFKRYILIDAHLSDSIMMDNEPFKLTCRPQDLSKRMKTYHNGFMTGKYKDTYVGIFAYLEDAPDHCVYEMIHSDKLNINGVLTSRMAAQRNKVAA